MRPTRLGHALASLIDPHSRHSLTLVTDTMFASFNRFTIEMTRQQAASASHHGSCDASVAALLKNRRIAHQLLSIEPDRIRAELSEYGCWDSEELDNHQDNLARIVWIAAGNIVDELRERTPA